MNRGTVKWFNVVRGFGFIIGDDGNEYFFHYSNIEGEGFKKVHDNEDVEFEPSKNEKGFIALNVQKHEWKKVASQLDDKKQPIYMTLDEVEKWLNDRINEEKKEQLLKDKLNKYKSILKYPQYAEWCKDVVFDTLNRFRTKGSKWLINEDRTFIESEVFNPKSELYAFTEYNVSNILDELHIHKFYNMPILEEIRIAFSEIYYKKYEELNADVLEKEVDDGEYILQDLVGDGELTENDLLEIAFNDIGIDGLKKFILNVED